MDKRFQKIPKFCSRCGNDLMTGKSIFNLPFENRYIVFCGICHTGLRLPNDLYQVNIPTNEQWKKFWEEPVK